MAEYREWIVACVYEKLLSKEADISLVTKDIDNSIDTLTKSFPNYKEKANINLEIVIPITLPPNQEQG